jgi:CxxC motif-containing protein (DUF1111 family)
MKLLRLLALTIVPALIMVPVAMMQSVTQAPAGFDDQTNGHIPQAEFDTNLDIFDEIETIEDGLGPVYNAKGCGVCHSNPVVGGGSSITELRAGHFNGASFVSHPGDSLIHTNAIAAAIQEAVLDNNEVRSFRSSLPINGDGFVEATANNTLINIVNAQPAAQRGTIITVPILEGNNRTLRVGRFGWKNQHASLESFAGDAYLNEMGITNLMDGADDFAVENTSNGRSVAAFDGVADPEDDGEDVEAFALFMRSLKAPPRGPITAQVTAGQAVFNAVGCAVCHTPSITTAPPGTIINGGEEITSAALGNKQYHPFGDFLLHNVGTGDGVVQNGGQGSRNLMRTMPLWGFRTRNRFMHDGLSFTPNEAIQRHNNQGLAARNAFNARNAVDRANLIAFLRSL